MKKHAKKLPIWWETFITEYFRNGQNGTRAYMVARPGVKEKTAKVEAHRVLTNPNFLVALEKARATAAEEILMPRLEWFKLLADIAKFDVSAYLTETNDGDTLLVGDWKERPDRHVLESVEITTDRRFKAGECVGETKRAKLHASSKLEALKVLGKALAYLKDKVEVSGSLGITAAQILDEELREKEEKGE